MVVLCTVNVYVGVLYQGIIQGGYRWILYPPEIHGYPPHIHLGISTFTGDQQGRSPLRGLRIHLTVGSELGLLNCHSDLYVAIWKDSVVS